MNKLLRVDNGNIVTSLRPFILSLINPAFNSANAIGLLYVARRFKSQLPPYDPTVIEKKWREQISFFSNHSNSENQQESIDFCMIFPPPNITGHLHCGHALTASIQDALCRYHAVHNKKIRWIPGTDHAGIATQTVVEKHLWKTLGKTRKEMDTPTFLKHTWDWVNQHQDHIYFQLKQLGLQMNWEEAFFTLDSPRSRIVQDAFRILYRRGLIYRDKKLIQWCPSLQTVISDIEVKNVSIPGPTIYNTPGGPIEVGRLHYLSYAIHERGGETERIVVSTTRIETILGDTAIAVHPNDVRYTKWIGKKVIHPLTGRRIPIIADERIDMNFGTGAVKITPGHDFNDFEIAQSHSLPIINLFDDQNKLTASCGVPSMIGMERGIARGKVFDLLSQCGAYQGSQPHTMKLPVCSRTEDILEPRLIPQWYLKCNSLAEKVMGQIDQGHLVFSQPWAKEEMLYWLRNINDWCISRQNGWGHPIPAFKSKKTHKWIVHEDEIDQLDPSEWVQDSDVLDTWFSSALLPISATNPNRSLITPSSEPLRDYPTSLIETGNDILFFWVARMAMLCTELTGLPPFRKVMLHGMIRDGQGRKMSKSLGNVIDPLYVCHGQSLQLMQEKLKDSNLNLEEVRKSSDYLATAFPTGFPVLGADTLRLTLLAASSARQINLDLEKFKLYHRMINKLWNTVNFALHHQIFSYPDLKPDSYLSLHDTWILEKLRYAMDQWRTGFEAHLDLGHSTQCLLTFLIQDFSQNYLETMKKTILSSVESKSVLKFIVQACIYLFYPMIPHVTLELHEKITGTPLISPVSFPDFIKKSDTSMFDTLLLLIQKARALTGLKQTLLVYTSDNFDLVTSYQDDILRSTKFGELRILDSFTDCPSEAMVVTPNIKLSTLGDKGIKEISNSQKLKLKLRLTKCITELETRMASEKYKLNANPEIQKRDYEKLQAFEERLKLLN